MGGACSARPAATPDTSEPPPSRHVVDVRPEIPQRPKRDSPPAAVESLVHLCVRSICLHIDRFQVPGFQLDVARYGASVGDLTPLALPFELSQRCSPGSSTARGSTTCARPPLGLRARRHRATRLRAPAGRVDRADHGPPRPHARARRSLRNPNLSDAGVAHLSTCKKLRELNLTLRDSPTRRSPRSVACRSSSSGSAAQPQRRRARHPPRAACHAPVALAGVAAAGDAAIAAACAGGACNSSACASATRSTTRR